MIIEFVISKFPILRIDSADSGTPSDEAKKELNALYNKFYAKLKSENPEDAEKFELSQKSWLKCHNINRR